LLHGGIECGGAMWAPVLAQLAQHHRVVVPDVPGLGESAPLDRLNASTPTPAPVPASRT
jgi:2-hydroxymuconate-semialdehyde hydrolase